mmetsp:Transcript_16496/g.49892  ORF Transcript_16496/g.49892 Transcript_16496/m.49892 type:complete len:431 (+) Transcript_16496:600-1892(+)
MNDPSYDSKLLHRTRWSLLDGGAAAEHDNVGQRRCSFTCLLHLRRGVVGGGGRKDDVALAGLAGEEFGAVVVVEGDVLFLEEDVAPLGDFGLGGELVVGEGRVAAAGGRDRAVVGDGRGAAAFSLVEVVASGQADSGMSVDVRRGGDAEGEDVVELGADGGEGVDPGGDVADAQFEGEVAGEGAAVVAQHVVGRADVLGANSLEHRGDVRSREAAVAEVDGLAVRVERTLARSAGEDAGPSGRAAASERELAVADFDAGVEDTELADRLRRPVQPREPRGMPHVVDVQKHRQAARGPDELKHLVRALPPAEHDLRQPRRQLQQSVFFPDETRGRIGRLRVCCRRKEEEASSLGPRRVVPQRRQEVRGREVLHGGRAEAPLRTGRFATAFVVEHELQLELAANLLAVVLRVVVRRVRQTLHAAARESSFFD